MAKRKLGVVLALSLLLVLSLGCKVYEGWLEEEPALLLGARPWTAQTAYPFAKARALEWRANAIPTEVRMSFPGDQIERGPDEISFTFVAESRQGSSRWHELQVIVYFQEGKVRIKEWGPKDYHSDASLEIESAELDSGDALQIAENTGGRAYREGHPRSCIRIRADRWYTGRNMPWVVKYSRACGDSRIELLFVIDAMTGEMSKRRFHIYVPPRK
jgi:hypothetical protein